MKKIIIFVFVALSTLPKSHQKSIQVFELRKEHTDTREANVDDQYFDPELLTGLKSNQDNLVNSLIEQITDLLKNKIRNTHGMKAESLLKELEDLINRVENHREASDKNDTGHLSVIVIPISKDKSQQITLGKLLRSEQQSQYEGIEDRTSVPRIRRPYDDDY